MKRFLSRLYRDPDTVADVTGALAVVALIVAGLWVAYGMGLDTSGDELLKIVK